jgi:hypothetical protein
MYVPSEDALQQVTTVSLHTSQFTAPVYISAIRRTAADTVQVVLRNTSRVQQFIYFLKPLPSLLSLPHFMCCLLNKNKFDIEARELLLPSSTSLSRLNILTGNNQFYCRQHYVVALLCARMIYHVYSCTCCLLCSSCLSSADCNWFQQLLSQHIKINNYITAIITIIITSHYVTLRYSVPAHHLGSNMEGPSETKELLRNNCQKCQLKAFEMHVISFQPQQ